MAAIFYNIFTIFAMVIIGYICCKTKVLPFEANEHLISLLINVTSPCLLITSITSKELTDELFMSTVQMLVGTAVYFAVGFILAYGIVRMLKVPGEDTGLYTMMLTAQNTGFMGFPVSKAAFGNEGLYYMVLSNILLNVYMYTAGMVQIGIGGERKKLNFRKLMSSMLNMCSVSAVIGIVMLFLGIKLPAFLSDVMTPIGEANIPISMIVLGVQLAESDVLKIIKNVRLVVITVISLTVWPLLTFLAVNWLPLYSSVKLIMVYASAFPTIVMIVAIAARENKNASLAAESVALSTLFSILTLPVATTLLSAYYGV